MLDKYQEAILLMNDLLSEPDKEKEIAALKREIEEFEKYAEEFSKRN